jgi:hypothetical protein
MSYMLRNKIIKCKEFSVLGETLFVISIDKTLCINSNNVRNGNFRFFGIYNDSQIIFDQIIFSSLLYDDQGKLIEEIQDYALRHIITFTSGNSLVGGNDGNNNFYGVYNFSNNTLLKRFENLGLNGVYQVIDEDLFLTQNNEKFGVFTFGNLCIWECKYKDLFKEYESIGAGTTNILHVSNKLFIELDKTYCINIETGKKENDFDVKLTTSENIFLYGFQFHNIEVIELTILNAKTNELRIINIKKEFKKHNVHPDQRIIVNQGLVYFSQNMGTHQAKVGVFDPEKCKILWLQVFEKENGMVGTIKVNGNRIYAHTQDNTLHIFEKTD